MSFGNNLKYAWNHVSGNYYDFTELSVSNSDLAQAITIKVLLTLAYWAALYYLIQFIPTQYLHPDNSSLHFRDMVLWLAMIPISLLFLLALTSMFASKSQFLELAIAQQSMDILAFILAVTITPLLGIATFCVGKLLVFIGFYTLASILPLLFLLFVFGFWIYKNYKLYSMILDPYFGRARAIFLLSFVPTILVPYLMV